jgi:hypothetical protein
VTKPKTREISQELEEQIMKILNTGDFGNIGKR